MAKFKTAIVLGAGTFGTSVASVLCKNFDRVLIKVRSVDIYQDLSKQMNSAYLPGIKLPKNLIPVMNWDEVYQKTKGEIELIVSGVPASVLKEYCRQNYDELVPFLQKNVPFISLSKGIDCETLELPDDLLYSIFPEYRDVFCFLSGPSFAKEIVEEQITLVSMAGRSRELLLSAAQMMNTNYFKVLLTYDIKGVLLGGALKNVLAIAAGIIEGLGHNHNTKAALITRGIQEMLRFGVVLNARPETFYGLSGMGDLILTTTGDLSRNRRFGIELAKGKTPEQILQEQRTVVEGYKTTKAVHLLSQRYVLRCRIFEGIYRILYEGVDPKDIIHDLLRAIDKVQSMIIE